jgi:hypothetical protein
MDAILATVGNKVTLRRRCCVTCLAAVSTARLRHIVISVPAFVDWRRSSRAYKFK